MNGTVTISLKDYEKLTSAQKDGEDLRSNTVYAIKELQVFLSFLCNRVEIKDHVEEFNRQSKTSKITITDGKALIQKIDGKGEVRNK